MKMKNYQSGLTLIEIMIALLIGAFLLGGVLQIFIGAKQTYRMQDNLSRMQENGRFAIEFLAKDIRMAGYWDCMSPSTGNNDDIAGVQGANAATPDSLTLRAAYVRSKAVADPCGTAVTPAATIACPKTADPANFYTDTTSIITYTINNNALRRATNCIANANADVVEGVENLKILYGIETDAAGTANFGTPNYYVSANSIPDVDADGTLDWQRVVSIRITLTVRSIDTGLTTTGDGRLRQTYSSTIAVRNRLL